MAHGITDTDRMVYVGQLPWHKLGIKLDQLATAQEVAEALQLYDVELRPTFAYNNDYDLCEIPEKFATVRTDTGQVLGIVGPKYRVFQNREALQMMDRITMDPAGPKYETAGTLWGGSKFWALARMPQYLEVADGDAVAPYLLLSNSHDGSSSVDVRFTPIRVVCNNTLSMALSQKSAKAHRMRHTVGLAWKAEEVQDALGIIRHEFAATVETYRALAATEPTREQIETVLTKLFPDTKSDRAKKQRERVEELAVNGIGSDVTRHRLTGWTLYNGVTELTDHHNNASSDDDSMRLNSIWYGANAKLKETALETIREVCAIA